MKVVEFKAELRQIWQTLPRPLGLVPTMGNLHEGHLNLVRRSAAQSASTIVTIFVNPLQFGPNEDFEKYPRVLDQDLKLLKTLGVDVVFTPLEGEMYPEGRVSHTTVSVPEITNTLCGASRPTHFNGVTTVVTKLFHLCQPSTAYFGEKDWQQLAVIRRMTQQLDFPITIEGIPTTRHPDGLAMSSRNQYLTEHERKVAPKLNETLRYVAARCGEDKSNLRRLEGEARKRLSEYGFKPDYVAIRDEDTLQETQKPIGKLRVFGAAVLGKARLIDNTPAHIGN